MKRYVDALAIFSTGESEHGADGLGIELDFVIADGFFFGPVDLIPHYCQH